MLDCIAAGDVLGGPAASLARGTPFTVEVLLPVTAAWAAGGCCWRSSVLARIPFPGRLLCRAENLADLRPRSAGLASFSDQDGNGIVETSRRIGHPRERGERVRAAVDAGVDDHVDLD